MWRITELVICGSGDKLMLRKSFGTVAIGRNGEAKMTRQQSEHTESDIFGSEGGKHFLNKFSIATLPIRMKNSGVDTDANSVAMVLAQSGGIDTLIEARGARLVCFDSTFAVKTPRNDCPAIRLNGQQVVDIAAFGQQHQVSPRETGEKGNEHLCQIGYVVEGEAVEHFAHIESDGA